MIDPRHIAVSIVGAVDWQSEVSGFCQCPGAGHHTHKTGKKDCRVNVDGAPTIYCFHASCAAVQAALAAHQREYPVANASSTLPVYASHGAWSKAISDARRSLELLAREPVAFEQRILLLE